ncbi:MAG: BrnT family toxin [Caldilineaceae bacterium]|nr:BrnT family toxin [Caldilineaceae bacterium]MBP8106175.1 BrnT family toxin [Caldilineaceae bacterium]MBP8124885.1 BrnT family toxin [Caldilineaceae bacterium]
MRIHRIIWLPDIVEKIDRKHGVEPWEVEEVLSGWVTARKVARGRVRGEDVYLTLGRSLAGRYLSVFFILKTDGAALPISARDMDRKERKLYGRL